LDCSCLEGLGAVLSQEQEQGTVVIAYASRSLHHNEKNMDNYSSMKIEMLALKWAVTEKFRDYLIGSKFIVYSDNNLLNTSALTFERPDLYLTSRLNCASWETHLISVAPSFAVCK
jgi:hypothetical protein